MRHSFFACAGSLVALSLVGCPGTPDRDGGVRVDAPVVLVDSPIAPGTDAPVIGVDAPGGTRVCTVGPAGACDVILQNCPMATDQCYLASSGAGMPPTTQCAPVMGTLSEGMMCTGLQACADGLFCNANETPSRCRHYCCDRAASDCPIGQSCIPFGDGTTEFHVGVCEPSASCEVIPQSGCMATEVCVAFMDGSRRCQEAGTAAIGASCGGTSGPDCVPDAICVGPTDPPDSPQFCREWCRIAMGATPNADCTNTTDTCQAIGGIDATFGVCFPAATP